jgi:hypothetical protein
VLLLLWVEVMGSTEGVWIPLGWSKEVEDEFGWEVSVGWSYEEKRRMWIRPKIRARERGI